MANVKVTLDYQINDGMSLTFKAPCDCTAVTGLIVYYPNIGEDSTTTVSKTFVFKDAHGNNLAGLGNLFMTGAYVKVILDTTNNFAYIQNADTNTYLEGKITAKQDAATAINTSNIGQQSVNYATNAGNSNTVGGFGVNLYVSGIGLKPIYAGVGDLVAGATALSEAHIYLQYE